MRIIKIETCKECQHRAHRGAFGEVSYIPCCTRTNENLPFNVETVRGRRIRAFASPTFEIPESCPLEKGDKP